MIGRGIHLLILAGLLSAVGTAQATVYLPGEAPAASGMVAIGNHLVSPDTHPSIAGCGGSGLTSAGGDTLDSGRTYIYDHCAQADLTDGIANRGDTNFAMMIWDMTSAYDSMRLYTHQDHYGGGPINDGFTAQDVMEYSVWGSQDGDQFVMLSDVIGFDLVGGGAGLPTYTFAGTAPSVVYRGGSAEFHFVNAYTREYVFDTAYRYYGIRTSQVSLDAADADPEIDAIGAFSAADRCTLYPDDPSCRPIDTPAPGALGLLGLGLLGVGFTRRRKTRR